MIRFTIFDPLSGRIISHNSCSHEEEVWAQATVGQGFVMGWRDPAWVSLGDEGFVRDSDTEFLRTSDWLDKHWPAPETPQEA